MYIDLAKFVLLQYFPEKPWMEQNLVVIEHFSITLKFSLKL